MAAFSTSKSVFLCLDSLNRLRSASKSIFDRSIAGAGLAGMSTPVIEASSSFADVAHYLGNIRRAGIESCARMASAMAARQATRAANSNAAGSGFTAP